ncbi:MAG: orotate phosphoribosyltransferase [Vampirovibrionales bacterium]|nr:orotate phosphoribosyltransferase [Vampirovibrionales bacterium]
MTAVPPSSQIIAQHDAHAKHNNAKHDNALHACMARAMQQPLFVQHRSQLLTLLKTHAVKRGHFTLASGKTSSVYLDTRQVSISAEGGWLIGWLFEALLAQMPNTVDAVGGMALGAAPLTSAVLSQSVNAGRPFKAGFLVRPNAKAHGTQQVIEGTLAPWMRIALLEDVITTGGSLKKALHAIKQRYPDVCVSAIFAVVDRRSEAEAATPITQPEIPLISLFQMQTLLD